VAFGKKAKTSISSSKGHGTGENISSAQGKPNKMLAVYIFWMFFFVLVICLFIGNMDAIQTSLQNTGVMDVLLNHPAKRQDILPLTVEIEDDTSEAAPSLSLQDPSWETTTPLETTLLSPSFETPDLADEAAAGTQADAPLENEKSVVTQPNPPNPSKAWRERGLYLIQVDPDGTILRTRITRDLPVTDSPLVDTLNALLEGPLAEEAGQGLISLIPLGTTILSASIRGSTAYINFNENFLFNEYGVEGYAGQLKQIVWTATEFSNIKDVQVLIEGRRLDYLGESIWIGSPVGRESH
jgi:spore germination protein GerM